MSTNERRIIVGVVSGADVRRLDQSDSDIRAEVQQPRGEVEALRRQLFEVISVFGDLKRMLRG